MQKRHLRSSGGNVFPSPSLNSKFTVTAPKFSYDPAQFSVVYRVSQKKRPAFERLLLPEYISNDILQYLIR